MLDTLRLDGIITAWLIHSEVTKDAMILHDLPRHSPEAGWCAILKVLNQPESEKYLPALSECLKNFILYHGAEFIELIEAQAALDSRFKLLLAKVHTHTGTNISIQLLERLTNAAGTTVKHGTPKTLEQVPNLSEALYATPITSEPKDISTFTESELEHIVHHWMQYQETLWAQEKITYIIKEEFIEYAYNVVNVLYAKSSSNIHLASIGAGPLEDLLKKNGEFIIDRIEQLASMDQRFRFCLSYVWPTNIAVDVWKRIIKARGNEPQRG